MSAAVLNRPLTLISLLLIAWLCALPARADEAVWALLKQGGQVVLIRHALTDPGVGDPPGFTLGDCKTQRNLSDVGRHEAQRLGAAIKARGVPVARVLASPWCRTLATARIAFGSAETETALGNLFDRSQHRERQMQAFRRIVAQAPRQGNLMLVTHGSTTLAFTGVSPATAEMVVVTPEADGRFRVAGRIAVPAAGEPEPALPSPNPR